MSERPLVLDPVVPRFCAQTGASLPLAWELAWTPHPDEPVVRLAPPPEPLLLDRGIWPRALPPDTVLAPARTARLSRTPVPFLGEGAPVAVLSCARPAVFAELPVAVGELLEGGASVAELRAAWGGADAAVDHLLVGLVRLGLLTGAPAAPNDAPRALVREAWVTNARDDILAHTPTGNFLRVGTAALALWQLAGTGPGVAGDDVPDRLRDVADRLLSAGMLRAVA
ncbi:hypothetical protein ABB07_39500 (plasmid) [Streptomyces incarnatus]|uniref:Uncharacterized protein n=1 Tax=Streptomyces incarnatus TaxID=665007 RepID=A0ABM5TXQ6_9ACTN|nr:hypothetical protein [Streptomyces incarnatus]AKJ15882.1 hypothetical protein ABB07_39500 [Streptomyces incarnatus]